MAVTNIPTRTSADPNASADINTLNSNDQDLNGRVTILEGASGGATTRTADYTVLDGDGFSTIYMNANNPTLTLPTSADNDERVILIMNIHASGWTIVDGEGAETINGLTTINLYSQYDYISVKSDGSNWVVLKHNINIRTGWLTRSDWTDVHLGSISLNYDNLTGVFEVGEIVSEDTTSAQGVVMSDSGSVLVLKDVSGGSTSGFVNNNGLTGGTSGATALVNGSTKNVDSDLIHNYGINTRHLKIKTTISTDATENNSFIIDYGVIDEGNASLRAGIQIDQVDTNSNRLQTGDAGIIQFQASGTISGISASDWFYQTSVSVEEII